METLFLKQQVQAIDYLRDKYESIGIRITEVKSKKKLSPECKKMIELVDGVIKVQKTMLWYLRFDDEFSLQQALVAIGGLTVNSRVAKNLSETVCSFVSNDKKSDLMSLYADINCLWDIHNSLAESFEGLEELKKLEVLLDERLNDNN
ncbi:hypothetical protein [uncultured Veillonella sp.]|uniref:hypothetical protein n=1 Tax=uncultured Veillonella sp. TaxID=159268 RepID=UPI0025ECE4FC|nr:hypothetical protein [uncultured Veillonella sp.]